MEDLHALRSLAEAAAARAGEVLRHNAGRLKTVESDSGRDVKAAGDRDAEQELLQVLEPTGIPILSEESGASARDCLDGACWILDPLDGTFNYVRGFPLSAVSVGFWSQGRVQFGVIHDVATAACYTGQVGEGAWCNGVPLHVSGISDTRQAVLATGFPTGRNFESRALARFIASIQGFKKIRMIGSAALSLANVAAGSFDIYFEEDIWLWDVAAGLALVSAAGGTTRYSEIKDDWKMDVMAWNGRFDPPDAE